MRRSRNRRVGKRRKRSARDSERCFNDVGEATSARDGNESLRGDCGQNRTARDWPVHRPVPDRREACLLRDGRGYGQGATQAPDTWPVFPHSRALAAIEVIISGGWSKRLVLITHPSVLILSMTWIA